MLEVGQVYKMVGFDDEEMEILALWKGQVILIDLRTNYIDKTPEENFIKRVTYGDAVLLGTDNRTLYSDKTRLDGVE